VARADTVLPPLVERSGLLRWLRRNLFNTWYDSLLTVLSLLLIYWVGKGLLTWAFTSADWGVVSANLRLFMVGQYPRQHDGRLWAAIAFLIFLAGNSLAIWARRAFAVTILLLGLPLLLALLPFGPQARQWLGLLTVTGLAGWSIGRARPEVLKRPVLIGWVICLKATLRSIGGLGLLLANAFFAALFWLFADWGWLPIENVAFISWIGLVTVAAILALGMSWSRLRRAGRARST